MTPTPAPEAPKQPEWWQTVVGTVAVAAANIVIAALAQRYINPTAAAVTVAAGTAAAHLARSPLQR